MSKHSRRYRQNEFEKVIDANHDYLVKERRRHWKLSEEWRIKILSNKKVQEIWETYNAGNPTICWTGSVNKNEYSINSCGYRLVRANNSKDVAPIHVDRHVGGKYRTEEVRFPSIWIPLNNVARIYSLPVAKGSHRSQNPIEESNKNTDYLSITYNEDYTSQFVFEQFNYKAGEALMFDSNLLHGGATNYSKDNSTRLSLEVRLYPINMLKQFYLWS